MTSYLHVEAPQGEPTSTSTHHLFSFHNIRYHHQYISREDEAFDEETDNEGMIPSECTVSDMSLCVEGSRKRSRRRIGSTGRARLLLCASLLSVRPPGVDAFALPPIHKKRHFSLFFEPVHLRGAFPARPNSLASSHPAIYNETAYGFWEDPLTPQSFNMDLANLASENPRKAHDALEIMHEMHMQYRGNATNTTVAVLPTIEPDARCYITVIDGYAQAEDPVAAQAVLDLMEKRIDTAQNVTGQPLEQAYLLVAQAWANHVRGDFLGKSASQAEALLQRLPEPSVKLWSIVLEAWCRRTGIARTALSRAEALLSEMEEAWQDKNESNESTIVKNTQVAPPPNIITYTSYIGGLARSKEHDLARKAEATLIRMQEFNVTPDVVAYTSVLNCWSRAVSRREREMAASRALRILEEMERVYSRGLHHAKPSHITYAAAIKAIGNSLDINAPKLAEDVLRRMYKLANTKTISNLKPTTATFNALLNTLSRATGNNKVRYARRAEQILSEMQNRSASEPDVIPNERTWAAVLKCWAVSGQPDAAENTQRILDKMEALHESGASAVRPNYVCYTTCMGAWGVSRRKDALDKLEEILMKMEKAYSETLEPTVRPNTISYVTAIDAFVRRNEFNAASRAQATVDRMMRLYSEGLGHVRPTKVVFNTLIHAWSKSRQKGAALRAEKIFRWMEAQAKDGDDLVRPDEVSLCAVLNAWANQAENGGAERAQEIFDHMQSIPLERRGFHLSIMMPNIVIKAIARSGDKDAVERAQAILQKLESDFIFDKSSLKPDVTTYSSVINCCAYYKHPEGRAEALEVALRTFHKLCDLDDDGPNNIVFGTLFKAIANLMPNGLEREELVSDLFDQCCDLGQVDAFVLSQVRHASPSLYRNLVDEPCGLGGPECDTSVQSVLQNIPQEWCFNL